jgi:dihydropteroate synthase
MIETPSVAARLYLRPVAFADTPMGRADGAVLRLAGGLQWFGAVEAIACQNGVARVLGEVPVAALDDWIATLTDEQGERAMTTLRRLTAPRAAIAAGERVLRFDQPQAMGILNVTPDSFSDGGAHRDDAGAAAAAGVDMAAKGAAIVDVGGESTRPGAQLVWEGEETRRVLPVIERLAASGTPVSIDTRKAAVMEAALAAGAHVVNDVAALMWDDRALDVVARAGCPVVLMHSPDPAKGADGPASYAHALTDVYDWLEARIEAVAAGGVDRARILIDPGIGFGKSLAHNLSLMNGLAMLHGLGCPVVLGASRKRMIGALSNEAPPADRLGGSLALALKGIEQGAQWIRVHDVAETVQAIRVWRGLRDQALVGG